MISESAKEQDFTALIQPHLDVLLAISFGLTKNGRDATKLMCAAMTEAFQTWSESELKEPIRMWLYDILTRHFYNGFQRRTRSLAPVHGLQIDESLIKQNPLFLVLTTEDQKNSSPIAEGALLRAFAVAVNSLPEVFRSAMILSYIEGLTITEIAALAGVHPHAIVTLLNSGYNLIRREHLALIVSRIRPDITGYQDAISA